MWVLYFSHPSFVVMVGGFEPATSQAHLLKFLRHHPQKTGRFHDKQNAGVTIDKLELGLRLSRKQEKKHIKYGNKMNTAGN